MNRGLEDHLVTLIGQRSQLADRREKLQHDLCHGTYAESPYDATHEGRAWARCVQELRLLSDEIVKVDADIAAIHDQLER